MSSSHIRQALSALEIDLRKEIMVLGPHWEPQMSLSDLIETMIQADLCKHPLYHRLLRLDAALCQLDLGLYGLCADCEAEIEAYRLDRDPTEQRCERCHEQYKHEHRQELRLNH
ncbi:TraR/DksA C4-type zinc finger protein [Shewanella algae]|uniref:TraR/DksA C4-type zinc finger protein n=1 Tax=Shewanella algae TaxID=38313 RepID=UPI0005EBFCFE|nr:TraR/DksA C4-type zinc finger protein [Shewanella algae]MCE9777980.1 TraR/DksA C4-type zinc finger protein [Shewanella algae]MCE9825965.1 TraR/DksA C4-type zinc finger protein [Shewanella algae]OXS00294.1 conjugal transfer protein TraR [Shewanella algae]PSS72583.1 conjugal transfer protein TraR [Shewanella algae]QGS59465.1 TraR/DksA family transcriptional regulator [Shewanella algae]